MPQALYPPERPQTIGEVLDTAFRIFNASLVKCLPIGFGAVVAGQLPSIVKMARGQAGPRALELMDPVDWTLVAIAFLLSCVLWSAMMLRQLAVVTRQPTSTMRELMMALRRLPVLTLSLLLYVIAMFAGLVLLILPGFYVGLILSLFWTAVVLKNKGPVESLIYSAHLIFGNFWRVAAIFTVWFIIVMVSYMTIVMSAAIIFPLIGATDLAVVWAFSTVFAAVVASLIAPLSSAIFLATFGDLQVRREGADLQQRIASIAPSGS